MKPGSECQKSPLKADSSIKTAEANKQARLDISLIFVIKVVELEPFEPRVRYLKLNNARHLKFLAHSSSSALEARRRDNLVPKISFRKNKSYFCQQK